MTERATVHATVRRWTPDVGGDALADDGSLVPLPPDCLHGSAFRFLRPGQRISLSNDADGATTVALP